MAGTIQVALMALRLPLAGLRGVDILVDGQVRSALQLGESASFEVSPGAHEVCAVLKGVVDRRSRPLSVDVSEGSETRLVGKYSRLWGKLRLSAA